MPHRFNGFAIYGIMGAYPSIATRIASRCPPGLTTVEATFPQLKVKGVGGTLQKVSFREVWLTSLEIESIKICSSCLDTSGRVELKQMMRYRVNVDQDDVYVT